MNTVRTNIMKNLLTGLTNIKIVNGYETDFKNVIQYVRDIGTIKNFPTCMIEIQKSVIDEDGKNESINLNSYTTPIKIVVIAKCDSNYLLESFIQDFKIYINCSGLDFDTDFFTTLGTIKYVKSYWIDSVRPYFNLQSKTGVIEFQLMVKHYEVIDNE